jgi:hypothetical protein
MLNQHGPVIRVSPSGERRLGFREPRGAELLELLQLRPAVNQHERSRARSLRPDTPVRDQAAVSHSQGAGTTFPPVWCTTTALLDQNGPVARCFSPSVT